MKRTKPYTVKSLQFMFTKSYNKIKHKGETLHNKKGKTLNSLISKIRLENEIKRIPDSKNVQKIRQQLRARYKNGTATCEHCSKSVLKSKDWNIRHLCTKECVYFKETLHVHKLYTHVCSTECAQKLKCVWNEDNIYFFCTDCYKPYFTKYYMHDSNFPLYLYMDRYNKHDDIILNIKKQLYQRFYQKLYIQDLLKCMRLCQKDIFKWLWNNMMANKLRCQMECGNTLVENLYVVLMKGQYISSDNTQEDDIFNNLKVVCKRCKEIKRCSLCSTSCHQQDMIVTYKSITNEDIQCYINMKYCTTCYVKHIYVNNQEYLEKKCDVNIRQVHQVSIVFPTAFLKRIRMFIERDVKSLQCTDKTRFNCEDNGLQTSHIISLLKTCGNVCGICSECITWPKNMRCKKVGSDFSINRINNSIPHHPTNVMISCWKCNLNYRTCQKCSLRSIHKEYFCVENGITFCVECFSLK